MSRIVASQGGGRYLLDCEYETDGKPQGQIIDTRFGRFWPPMLIHSLLARGYWQPVEVAPGDQEDLLRRVPGLRSGRVDAADSGPVERQEALAKRERKEDWMANKIEYFKVTESGFPPEFARVVYTENGQELQAYRDGKWALALDLGDVFFKGKGKVEQLKEDPHRMTQKDEALALGTRAHAGQVDKAGRAYIDHPVRVAERLKGRSEAVYVAGLLHDTVEDTEVTLAAITEQFGGEVANLVDAVTKREGESKPEYYARVKAAGPDAVALKMADIADNTDPERLAHLPAELQDRLTTKYAQAVAALR